MYCCFVPYGWYVKASNTVSQFQQRLLHNFRNQSPTTFDKDHCCIIVCRLRGLSSSILSNRRCQYLEVDSGGFILYFWYSLAPPPPPIRHAKATTGFLASRHPTLGGWLLFVHEKISIYTSTISPVINRSPHPRTCPHVAWTLIPCLNIIERVGGDGGDSKKAVETTEGVLMPL